jgi:imidazole glycerol-phosphate synthase subunit HisF
MLKKRIIPLQLLYRSRLVKSVRFAEFRDVGDPVKSASVYNSQSADELIVLNVERDHPSIEPLLQVLGRIAETCFMPLTIGGGVRTMADAQRLFEEGADKVVVNSAAYGTPAVITEIARRYGSQAVVVGIDARYDDDAGTYVLYSDCGGRAHRSLTLSEHVGRVVGLGAGEILIQSIDHDGTMAGYDLRLTRQAAEASTVPVIAAGGAGNYEHLREAFVETEVSALACGSLFNFSDSHPMRAKAFLSNHGLAFKRV